MTTNINTDAIKAALEALQSAKGVLQAVSYLQTAESVLLEVDAAIKALAAIQEEAEPEIVYRVRYKHEDGAMGSWGLCTYREAIAAETNPRYEVQPLYTRPQPALHLSQTDQSGFEEWAKNHGGLVLMPVGDDGAANHRMFPATYFYGDTEIAWRAWANKPALPPMSDAVCGSCIGSGLEPSVYDGKVPCGSCAIRGEKGGA